MDRRLRRRLLAGTGTVLLLIFGLLGYGWFQVTVVQPSQPVAEINGEIISAADFRGRVLFAQWNLLQQYQSLQQFLGFLGGDPQSVQPYQEQLAGLQFQLSNPEFLGDTLLDEMIQEVLIRQEAQRRGIRIEAAEVEQSFERAFGFFPEGTPTPHSPPSPTAAEANGSAESTALAAAPTAIEPVVGLQETVDPAATPQPSATPYTRELFETNYRSYISTLKVFGVDEDTIRGVRESQLYRQRLREAFADRVDRSQEQVWARHILVAEQALAEELQGRIATGESWEQLAAEYSEDVSNKDRGGDLGWFGRGVMVEPFEEAAFGGEVGQVVGPVQSNFGWHLIEILGHEIRPLQAQAYERELDRVFSEWLTKTRQQADVVIHDYWVERLPPPQLIGS